MPEKTKESNQTIKLSQYTQALIETLKNIKEKPRPDDLSKLEVSQTVSFFALVYERLRNAVEFREDHLILRAAIERVIKRRLSLNPKGDGEAENLLRELLWARYFDNGSLGREDIIIIQKIIGRYLLIRNQIVIGRNSEIQQYLNQFILDLLTCEIEETLNTKNAQWKSTTSFFIYQVIRKKIQIEGISEEQKDAFFLTAIEKAYGKSDKSYLRYHLFIAFYQPIHQYSKEELSTLAPKLPEIFKKIDDLIKNPYVDGLYKFTKKQLPPFLILFEIIKRKFGEIESILTNKEKLLNEIDFICRDKYQQLSHRIRNLAIRAFIYIFFTKMLFAIVLEYPLSLYIYGSVHLQSIAINSFFPPILMAIILLTFRIPDENNTKKISQRLIEIIDADRSFENQIAYIPKKPREKKASLIFGFTIFYSLTFIITFVLIYEILIFLKFNLISQIIFIFFVSVVSFFSYRIKKIVNEYKLEEKESILTPIADFFFMPILSLGKFFSQEIARFNFFIFIFDFLIEAPFKMIFEVIEEWIAFVKKRKEEII